MRQRDIEQDGANCNYELKVRHDLL